MTRWSTDKLKWKLQGTDLIGIDSGNVRRVEAVIDGTQVGARVYAALEAAPDDVRRTRNVRATLELGPHIERD